MNPDPIDGALTAATAPADALIVRSMHDWLQRAVIGLNLCPFARAVEVRGQVRYAVSHAASLPMLLNDLENEATLLLQADPALHDTTLLMVAQGQEEFLEFHFTVGESERRLRACGWADQLQIASFHPRYQFAGAEPDDIANSTNRAPWPTLQLLRQASVEKAVAAIDEPADIYQRNIETLRRLGAEGWQRVMAGGAPSVLKDTREKL